MITENVNKSGKSFAIVVRGHPEDFTSLATHAKSLGLYVVYTKTSHLKLVVEEVPF